MPQQISPGDLLRPPIDNDPPKGKVDLSEVPESWRTAVEKAEDWPFVDPDVMLNTPAKSFSDYPADVVPSDIIPFSEFEPWGKMEEETGRDYELFSHYRASGLTRSQSATARFFKISQTYVSKVYHKRDWEERAQSWDKYREQVYTTEVIEGVKAMAREHAGIANKGIKALSIVFDELLSRVEDNDPIHQQEIKELGLKPLFALVDKAARAIPNLMNAERLSRGLPTELSAQVIVREDRILVQSTDELAEIVKGLQSVFESTQLDEPEDQIIDIEEEVEEAVLVDS